MFKFLIPIVIIFFFSCNYQKKSEGISNRIVVFSEPILWDTLKDTLKKTIGSPWKLPIHEQKFRLVHKNIEKFKRYKTQKNLMFIVSDDQKNSLNKLSDKIIPSSFKPLIENETYNFFLVKNLYASNQLVFILHLKKTKNAAEIFGHQFTNLETFSTFEKLVEKRFLNELFRFQEDDNAHNMMVENHGYSIRTPYRFQLIDNNTHRDSNLVSIFQRHPIQWAMTKKINDIDEGELSASFLMDHRDKIMLESFEGDSVDRDNIVQSDIEIDGLKGIRIQGSFVHSENGNPVAGGPFISYGLYDYKDKCVYFLDAQVFDIGKPKSEYLMKMETILKTFRRVNHEKKDELLSFL
jgi:hypothetical protein